MTGFGSGRATSSSEEVSVELRALNHKFCEVKPRLPRELASFEALVVKTIKERFARGAIDVIVKRQSVGATASIPVVDTALAQQYRRSFSSLAQLTGLKDELTVAQLAALPGVIRLEESIADLPAAQVALTEALGQAMEALLRMREVEGSAIKVDLEARLQFIEASSAAVRQLAPQTVEEFRVRLVERVNELARDVAVDPQRLAQEVAIFADRTDIAEELTRLGSHTLQFRQFLAAKEPSGRKMDFLVQEMHREVNTTGSKSQHPEISRHVVNLKAELERIREQVQNIE